MDLSAHYVTRKDHTFIRNVKGTVEFESPADKSNALKNSKNYLGKSLVRTISNPRLHLEKYTKQSKLLEWATLHPHAPGDRVNIENVHKDTTAMDLKRTVAKLNVQGFVQAFIFENNEAMLDLRKTAGFRKGATKTYNFAHFAILYFESAEMAYEFEQVARTKKIKVRGNELHVRWKGPPDVRSRLIEDDMDRREPLEFKRNENSVDYLGHESLVFDEEFDSAITNYQTENQPEDLPKEEGVIVEKESFDFSEEDIKQGKEEAASIKI